MPTLKGTEMSWSYIQGFFHFVSSPVHVFIFHITWLDTLWIDLVYIAHRHSLHCGDKQREKGAGAKWRWTKGETCGQKETLLGVMGA